MGMGGGEREEGGSEGGMCVCVCGERERARVRERQRLFLFIVPRSPLSLQLHAPSPLI